MAAETAGLHYVSDQAPGYRRRRRGKGFSYHRPDGSIVRAPAELERIRSLAVPPAWTDVWICADPAGHLQATGRDARGRKQYRYHPRWRAVRDADKFAHLLVFGHALADLRDRVDAALRRPKLDRAKVLALTIRLLDETLIRVGNERYVEENDSYGLTTITPDHVELGWSEVTFDFVGKGGREHHITIHDARVARAIRRCHELGGQELFAYREDDDVVRTINSTDVNDYLHELVGAETSAKDFRTWGGTVSVVGQLGPLGAPESEKDAEAHIIEAIDHAAERLGNTRTVCRTGYVHPMVLDAYASGALEEHWNHSRTAGQLDRAERATLRVLEEAQPKSVSDAA